MAKPCFFTRARAILAALSVAFAILVAAPASAQTIDINTDKAGVALLGYDPVAYFTRGKPIRGNPAISTNHAGATYRFASEDHRKRFVENPAKYLPAYGGFCAYGVSQGYKVKIDPAAFRVVDGKLYLNYDRSVARTWAKDIPGYISAAEKNWPGLVGKPRAD